MNKLDNKVAVITGGTTGIGQAAARLFHEQGARVFITGRNEKTLAEAKNGKPYLALSLMDRTGDIEARIWDNASSGRCHGNPLRCLETGRYRRARRGTQEDGRSDRRSLRQCRHRQIHAL